jgi:hypothetical protein
MVNLLGRGRFSGACSPESEGPQQPIEIDQGGDVDCRRSKGHHCADGGIKHPGGQDDRHAPFPFRISMENQLTISASSVARIGTAESQR